MHGRLDARIHARGSSDASNKVVIGLAMIAGAVVLAWLSSVSTMRLERAGGAGVTVTIESRLFNLIDIGRERIEAVKSVEMVRSRAPGSDSDTPDRLVFQAAAGPVDLGRAQQLFVRDFSEVKAFVDDPTQPEATFSSIGRGEEFRRFLFAQAAAAFLFLVGAAVAWSSIRNR